MKMKGENWKEDDAYEPVDYHESETPKVEVAVIAQCPECGGKAELLTMEEDDTEMVALGWCRLCKIGFEIRTGGKVDEHVREVLHQKFAGEGLDIEFERWKEANIPELKERFLDTHEFFDYVEEAWQEYQREQGL